MPYDERSNGQEISVKTSEEFEVALPETRTAGYRWVTAEKGQPIVELSSETAIPNAGATGGASHHLWRFRGISPGRQS